MRTDVTGDASNKKKTILFLVRCHCSTSTLADPCRPTLYAQPRMLCFDGGQFGATLPNAQLLADEYADAGFYVVLPDLMKDDPIDHNLLKVRRIAPRPR